jgi:hypothetical protein
MLPWRGQANHALDEHLGRRLRLISRRLIEHHRQPHARLVLPLPHDRQVCRQAGIALFLSKLKPLAGLGHLMPSSGQRPDQLGHRRPPLAADDHVDLRVVRQDVGSMVGRVDAAVDGDDPG